MGSRSIILSPREADPKPGIRMGPPSPYFSPLPTEGLHGHILTMVVFIFKKKAGFD